MIQPTPEGDAALDLLARRLADGERVDWEDSQRRDPAQSAAIGHLRELERVMRAHQGDSVPVEPGQAAFHWGPLEVHERIGRGGFAEVYRAHDPALRRDVALKLRRDDAGGSGARWLSEARRLARVRHPNVLAVHGADVHDGRAGFWAERIEGETLEDWLERNGALGAAEAAAIGRALCAAVAAVHAAGLVHGDIKTRNVMRRAAGAAGQGGGDIVLMDFGAALAADDSGVAAAASSEGTPLAMAPERLDGGPATVASDLYAIGAVLFRLVTRRHPCEGDTIETLRARHAHGERLLLRDLRPDLPASFVATIERALAPSPGDRFASAAAFEAALLPVPAGARGGARRVAAPVAVVALVAVGLWWLVAGRPAPWDPPPPPATAGQVPPSVAAPAPVAALPPALEPRASLRRLRDGAEAVVVTGSQLEPGDRLWLDLRAPEPVHAYVLDEDASGDVFVLFPMSGSPLHNPLAGDATHALPGRREGRPLQWLVTSADGRETFLVVVSRAPVAALEEAVASLPRPRPGRPVEYARLSPATLRRMRGVGEVVEGGAARVSPGAIATIVRALEARPDRRDLWWQVIETETPLP